MELLQSLDPNTLALLGVACAVLCVVGVVLLLGAQVFGIIANLIGGLTGIAGGFAADPFSCCGCLALIAVVVLCGGGIFVLSQLLGACGTPDATNFCSLFGR